MSRADSVQPTVVQAAVVRSSESLERWGENAEIIWAHDGRGLIILVRGSSLCWLYSWTSAQILQLLIIIPDDHFPPSVLSASSYSSARIRIPADQHLPTRRRSWRRRCPARLGAACIGIRIRHGRMYQSVRPIS